MSATMMKTPGPDHPITIAATPGRVRVLFGGRVIANSARPKILREAKLPEVIYIPRDDVDWTALERTDHRSHCPYKGRASYFSIHVDGRVSQNAAWSYETPYPAMAEIAEYIAFYPDRVDAIEAETPG